jgi:hypothetical protein
MTPRLLRLAFALGLFGAFAALDARTQTITIAITSDLAGATLSGSGTNATVLSAGMISKQGGAPSGVTLTTSASSWSIGTPFDVTVTPNLLPLSTSYTLQAQLTSADAVRHWFIDSIQLNSSTPVTITATGTYVLPQQHTFSLQIPDNSPAGALSNTITLTAIAN